jgi:hypothetical protein
MQEQNKKADAFTTKYEGTTTIANVTDELRVQSSCKQEPCSKDLVSQELQWLYKSGHL